MRFNLKVLAVATAVIASSPVFAAPSAGTTVEAGTEIHWSGDVPTETGTENVILTSLNGVPLTEALKGGDLYVSNDGTFTSSSIPLELHYRTCADGGSMDTSGVDTCTEWATGSDEIGDLVTETDWNLLNTRVQIGGVEEEDVAAQVLLDSAPMTAGTAIASSTGTAKFTTVNDTATVAEGEAVESGTLFSVFASVVASKTL